jgi:Domain of unknown function (DUF4129)
MTSDSTLQSVVTVSQPIHGYLDSLAGTTPFLYANRRVQRTWWDDFMEWWNELFISKGSVYIDDALLWISIAIVVAVVYVIATKMGIIQPLFRRDAAVRRTSDTDEPQAVPDLDYLARQCESEGNYRLALRYRFLIVLTLLHNAGVIHWKRHGTNSEYVQQLSGSSVHVAFLNAVHTYEQGWYGMHGVSKAQYESAIQAIAAVQSGILSGRSA